MYHFPGICLRSFFGSFLWELEVSPFFFENGGSLAGCKCPVSSGDLAHDGSMGRTVYLPT